MYKLPAYIGVIVKKDNQVLLVKRHNTDWASGEWNFPGGLLEEHETLINGAVREAQEEVGIIAQPTDFELVHVLQVHKSNYNTKDIIGFYFMAKQWHGTPINKEPRRHSEIGWFDMNNLPKNSTPHALQALQGLKTGLRYSEN